MNRLAGRNAIVTGSSRGIGAGIAERFAAEGANVILVARTVEKHDHLAGSLNETLEKCLRYGTSVHAVAADLSDEQSRAEIVPRALELFDGRIDVLVNNAAAAMFYPTSDFPLRRRRLLFEVNVHATSDLSQAVIPGMRARAEGWILNVSSSAAKYTPGTPASGDESAGQHDVGMYGASKAALNRMTYAFAEELAGTGIRVNTLAPQGAVWSEGAAALLGSGMDEGQVESMEAMVEATLALCDCPEERTGGTHYSLDLLQELGTTVMTLDSTVPYPGGFRVHRG